MNEPNEVPDGYTPTRFCRHRGGTLWCGPTIEAPNGGWYFETWKGRELLEGVAPTDWRDAITATEERLNEREGTA